MISGVKGVCSEARLPAATKICQAPRGCLFRASHLGYPNSPGLGKIPPLLQFPTNFSFRVYMGTELACLSKIPPRLSRDLG